MAVNPALIKAVVVVATDKRTWITVLSIIIGLIFTIIAVVGAFLNMFSFDDTMSETALPEYVEFVSSMKDCYKKLDAETDKITGVTLDKEQIHAVFYTMYFGNDKNMDSDFYKAFVNCFVKRTVTDDEEIVTVNNMESTYLKLQNIIGKEIPTHYRKQIDELYLVLRFGSGIIGDDGTITDIGGVSIEAYSDTTFKKLMDEATKYIGYPYVWGGSTPSTSFDCSGFVCWSYTKSGVYNLPRTTAQAIYNMCSKISESEAKPGDLIFFTRTYVSVEPVTHIGIYVGDGKMLHCGDPIKYVSIKTDFWKSHFYGFGRLSK